LLSNCISAKQQIGYLQYAIHNATSQQLTIHHQQDIKVNQASQNKIYMKLGTLVEKTLLQQAILEVQESRTPKVLSKYLLYRSNLE
jgi:hypothetical protein